MFDSIAQAISGSPWTYVLLVAVVAGDAVFPALPGETVVIAAAVVAAQDHLNIALVVVAAGLGALLGDNAAYAIGHSGLRQVADRLLRSGKNRHRLEWARSQLAQHGVWIIIVARFIPGGRTATTYVAGTVGMPWRQRFLPADVTAAVIWALYASALGYLGGTSFENNIWLPMLLGAGASFLIGGLGELVRRKVLDRRTEQEGGGSRSTDVASAEERATAEARLSQPAPAGSDGPSQDPHESAARPRSPPSPRR